MQHYAAALNGNVLALTANDGPATSIPALNVPSDLLVGAERAGTGGLNAFLSGELAEDITYDRALTDVEKRRVSSYLATKYGVTLESGDYLDSAENVIWDATTNASYHHDIAGIGRDDATVLHQKQSRSVNDDAIVTIGSANLITTTNQVHTGTLTNQAFMLWGNDNAPMNEWTVQGAPASKRVISRTWKIAETGIVGSVLVSVPDDGSSEAAKLPAELDHVFLLVDSDTDFTNAPTAITMTLNGTQWQAAAGLIGIATASSTF